MPRRQLLGIPMSVVVVAAAQLAAPPAVSAADPVIIAAGDIADCSTTKDSATARRVAGIPGTVLTLGDNAYPDGTAANFRNCYHPTWGRFRSRTRPSAGNHDYKTSGAAGYFGYFGSRAGARGKGYYSFNRGTWHLIALNSNCGDVSCGRTSAQVRWLKADLAANRGKNVLAYWHHPRFSSGKHGNDGDVRWFWSALYAAGADVILNGHDHDYERFAPQTPSGRLSRSYGIRQFVVGTGGRSLRTKGTTKANSQVFSSRAHGVLKLRLHAHTYTWSFKPISGDSFTDSGTRSTHGRPPSASIADQEQVALSPVEPRLSPTTLPVAADIGPRPGATRPRPGRALG